MFVVDNFISFHDLTPSGNFLWASSSIEACLGYDPEEVVGWNAYDVIHPEDFSHVKVVHGESMMNEMVGTQVLLRIRHKNGEYVQCMVLFSICYDYIVSCFTLVDQSAGSIRKVGTYSAAMTSLVGSKEEEFARIRRHHQAFRANTWNPDSLELEPRVCMLLNRFSRSLCIMYASPSCEMILKIDSDLVVGKPFLLYVRSDDLGRFVEQVDIAKSSSAVTHMKLWFQSPDSRQEIPCEIMLFGAADGMIAILRRCKPFVRKYLITEAPPSEYFASASSANSSFTYHTDISSGYNRCSNNNDSYTFNVDSNFNVSSSCSNSQSNSDCNINNRGDPRLKYMYSIDDRSARYRTSNSSVESAASSYSSSTSGSSFNHLGHRAYGAPLRNLPIGSINSIRNLDNGQNELRPLTSIKGDEVQIVDSDTALPEGYRLRRHHVVEPDVEETGLEEYIDSLALHEELQGKHCKDTFKVPRDIYTGSIDVFDTVDDDGCNSKYPYFEEEYEELQMPSSRVVR